MNWSVTSSKGLHDRVALGKHRHTTRTASACLIPEQATLNSIITTITTITTPLRLPPSSLQRRQNQLSHEPKTLKSLTTTAEASLRGPLVALPHPILTKPREKHKAQQPTQSLPSCSAIATIAELCDPIPSHSHFQLPCLTVYLTIAVLLMVTSTICCCSDPFAASVTQPIDALKLYSFLASAPLIPIHPSHT
jgi:hypothetical protein